MLGAQFGKHTRIHCGRLVPYKADRSRRAAGGETRELRGREAPLCPSRHAPQWRSRSLPRLVFGRPGPDALLPGALTSGNWRGPGLGVELGAWAGPGRQPVSGCSGNSDVCSVGGASTQVAYFRK